MPGCYYTFAHNPNNKTIILQRQNNKYEYKIKELITTNIDGIAINDDDLENLHEYNITDTRFPPICIWSHDMLLLLGSNNSGQFGIFVVPRSPNYFECQFLKKPHEHICNTNGNGKNHGKYLKLKICDKCVTLTNIIKYHIVKACVDGRIDGILVNEMPIEGTKGHSTLLYWNKYTEKKLSINITMKKLGPMCIWTKQSILFLAKNNDDMHIYKLARNPTDNCVNYMHLGKEN